jgi:hypothetical protein
MGERLKAAALESTRDLLNRQTMGLAGLAEQTFKTSKAPTEAGTGTKDFGDALAEVADNPQMLVPFIGSVAEAGQVYDVFQAAKRVERGEGSEEDFAKLKALQDEAERGSTFGYKVGSILSQLPAFGLEFALTGGVGKVAGEAAEKAALKAARGMAEKAIVRGAAKTAGTAVRAGAQAAVFAPMTAGNTIRRMTPEIAIDKDDEGQLSAIVTQEGDGFLEALAKGYGETFIEVFSERTGGLIGQLPLAKKLGAVKTAAIARWLKKNPEAGVSGFSKFLKRAGWDGVVSEIAEERIGEGLRTGLLGDPYQLPSLEDLAAEAVAFSIPGAAAAVTAPRAIRPRRAKAAAADVVERGAIVEPKEIAGLRPSSPSDAQGAEPARGGAPASPLGRAYDRLSLDELRLMRHRFGKRLPKSERDELGAAIARREFEQSEVERMLAEDLRVAGERAGAAAGAELEPGMELRMMREDVEREGVEAQQRAQAIDEELRADELARSRQRLEAGTMRAEFEGSRLQQEKRMERARSRGEAAATAEVDAERQLARREAGLPARREDAELANTVSAEIRAAVEQGQINEAQARALDNRLQAALAKGRRQGIAGLRREAERITKEARQGQPPEEPPAAPAVRPKVPGPVPVETGASIKEQQDAIKSPPAVSGVSAPEAAPETTATNTPEALIAQIESAPARGESIDLEGARLGFTETLATADLQAAHEEARRRFKEALSAKDMKAAARLSSISQPFAIALHARGVAGFENQEGNLREFMKREGISKEQLTALRQREKGGTADGEKVETEPVAAAREETRVRPQGREETPRGAPGAEAAGGRARRAKPRPIDVAEQPANAPDVQRFQPVEYPVAKIELDPELPNFKEGAGKTGVVEGRQLQGKFSREPIRPIVVWERKNGRTVVITGRHRFDLAKRSGETTIPAQVFREDEGFTLADALNLDAISNIQDEQGTVKDYARYFRSSDLTEEEAREGGLFSRVKGRSGWHIGKDSVDVLYEAFINGGIGERAAVEIARTAPGNERLQIAGLNFATGRSHPSPEEVRAYLQALATGAGRRIVKADQSDLFGSTTDAEIRAWEREARAMGKAASDTIKEIREKISAAQGAAKNPAAAKKLGVDVSDPEATARQVDELRELLDRWQNYELHPDLIAEARRKAGLSQLAVEKPSEKASEAEVEKSVAIPAEKRARRQRQPWQMDLPEYRSGEGWTALADPNSAEGAKNRKIDAAHRDAVKAAVERGEDVPKEVLADYPELTRARTIVPGSGQPPVIDAPAGAGFTQQPSLFKPSPEQNIEPQREEPEGDDIPGKEDVPDMFAQGTATEGRKRKRRRRPRAKKSETETLEFKDQGPASAPDRIRVKPEPRPGTKPKPLRDMMIDLSKVVGRKIAAGRAPRGVLGTYYPGSARTTIRFAGDIDTAAHEAAHALDDKFGIVADWAGKKTLIGKESGKPYSRFKESPFDEELVKFWWHGSAGKSGPRSKLPYKRAEGVAEWVRAYIVNPEAAIEAAPQFHAFFKTKVPKEVVDQLDAFGADVRAWAGSRPAERTIANVAMAAEPTGVIEKVKKLFRKDGYDFEVGFWDRLGTRVADSLSPIWKAMTYARTVRGIEDLDPVNDPFVRMRLFAGMNEKVEDVLEHGPVTATDERAEGVGGFKWLFEPLDTSSGEKLDTDIEATVALMVAERTVEQANHLEEAALEIFRLSEQVDQLTAIVKKIKEEGANPEDFIDLVKDLRTAKARLKAARQRLGFNGPLDELPGFIEAKKSRLTGAGAGLVSDTAQARGVIKQLGEDPARLERITEAARRYRRWANSLLSYMLDKGRISQAQYNEITQSNKFYVSFHRLMDDVVPRPAQTLPSKRLGSVGRVLQKFQGSTRTIENPYLSLMRQTIGLYREADRNEALRLFTDLLTGDRAMYEGQVQNLAAVGYKAAEGDPDTITIYRDGQKEHWKFQKDVFEALKGMHEDAFPGWLQIASIPPQLARSFITHSPDFLIRNVQRDALARFVLSETATLPLQGIGGVNAENLSRLRRSGGGQAGHYLVSRQNYDKEMRKVLRQLARDKRTVLGMPGRLLDGYKRMARSSEMVGRLAEFETAYKKAKEELDYDEHNARLYAAYHARDLLDYAVAGSWIKALNRMVPFTNAAIQGLRKANRRRRSNPLQFYGRMVAFSIPMSALEIAIATGGGDEEELFQLPAWRRDLFWNFKIMPDTWLSIPKPFELGLLSSAMTRAMGQVLGDKRAWEGFGGSVLKAFVPFDESVLAGPFVRFVEAIANRDFFKNRYIVPPWEIDLELKRRDVVKTSSRLGQILQKAIGTDARTIDHLIESEFGGIGRAATTVSDLGREDRPASMTYLLRGLSGTATGSPASASRDANKAFDLARKIGKPQAAELKPLRRELELYRSAKTLKARDRAAERVRREGVRARRAMERAAE